MLTKDPEKRIGLKELLMHPWLVKDNPHLLKVRKEAKGENEFRMFTLSNPGSVKIYDDVKKRSDEVSKSISS